MIIYTVHLTQCSVKEISREYGQTLTQVNAEEDLRWYALNFGTGMNYNWPEFEVAMLEENPLAPSCSLVHALYHQHSLLLLYPPISLLMYPIFYLSLTAKQVF